MADKLAFGVEPSDRVYRLRLSRYFALAQTVARFVKDKGHSIMLLDIGAGRGRTLRYCEAAGLDGKISFYGIDISRKRISTIYGKKRWKLIMANVEKGIPFDDAVMDVIVIEQVLEHIKDPDFTLKEISRVLKKGGLLIVGVPIFPPLAGGIRKLAVYILQRYFNIKRSHIQSFTLRTIFKEIKKTNLFDITEVRGFRIISGGILSPLEDYRWWWRFNTFLGRIMPSLSTEIQALAVKK